MGSRVETVTSLYRSYLRQARNLPHLYLRQFYQICARDDIDSIMSTKGDDRRANKLKAVQKRIQRIQKANSGNAKAFNRIIELAFGRAGKLKWELVEPIKYHPTTPLAEPIIAGVEKSKPLVYSPELKVLLTSSLARLNKPLDRKDLITPRRLPARANPLSEEALTFGQFSKRREVNIRRRFFQEELKKVLPPLEVMETEEPSCDAKVPFRPIGFQQRGVLQELETLIGRNLFCRPPKTRRERRASFEKEMESTPTMTPERHPSRWVRRRYRALLAQIPQLVYNSKAKPADPFRVVKHPLGHHPHDRSEKKMPNADPVTMAWIEYTTKKQY